MNVQYLDVQYRHATYITLLSMPCMRRSELSTIGSSRVRRRDGLQRLLCLLGVFANIHGSCRVAWRPRLGVQRRPDLEFSQV